MKKFFTLIVLALMLVLVFVMPLCANAAEEADNSGQTVIAETTDSATTEPYTPFTWGYLATLAGATAATLLIVQFTKAPLDKVWKVPTRLFVYGIALLILITATAFTSGITLQNVFLAVVNAFLVALTAYGSYEVTFAKRQP